MKLSLSLRFDPPSALARRSRAGSAVIIVLVLLGLLAALMAANTRVLQLLKKDLQTIERQQLKTWATPNPAHVGERPSQPKALK